jgi:hypothetical protein
MPLPSRRFTLIDAMVFVAVVAAGFALARDPYLQMNPNHPRVNFWRAWVRFSLVYPFVTPATFAVTILGLWRDRASPGRFLRPGLAGCLAAAVALVLRGFEVLPAFMQGRLWQIGPIRPWLETSERMGYAIAGAWGVITLGRALNRGYDWLERAALGISLIWVVALIVGVFRMWVPPAF